MILWFFFQLALCSILLCGLVYFCFFLPPIHPKNIPAVPFYVALLPLFKDVDQEDTYHKYLEKPLREHGAVKIYFGARWNIIVQRSEYLAEVFREEEVFQKTGNQKKIPHAVVSEFLGDNVISARSETWKLYREIITPGLQRDFDPEPLLKNASLLCGLIRDTQRSSRGNGVAVQELLQRYTIANVSQSLLQTDFETLSNPAANLNKLQSAVKRQIFQPIFLSFPFLDRLPIPSRLRARELVRAFSRELITKLRKSHEGRSVSMSSDKLGSRLLAAHDQGLIDDKQLRDNLNVTFVAGQENPQLSLISIMYLLAKHPNIQSQVRTSTAHLNFESLTSAELIEIPYLTAMVNEALRLFPPISQLINRRTSVDTLLGNTILIPKNTFVGYNCYSTNRDKRTWGADSNDFQPERWGDSVEDVNKEYRRRKRKAEFATFHGGKRACLGEKFAMLELRISVVRLVREFEWELDPTWKEKMTPAGPLYPRALRLLFRDLRKVEGASV